MSKRDDEVLTFLMTRATAESFGLLCCDTCGHPANNHWNFNEGCAHDGCPKYEERGRGGMELVSNTRTSRVKMAVAELVRDIREFVKEEQADVYPGESHMVTLWQRIVRNSRTRDASRLAKLALPIEQTKGYEKWRSK